MKDRFGSGIDRLDELLGGGFLPGSLVMIVGATGVGKTQLGLQFIDRGRRDESVRGAVIDLSSRGDSQNHRGYYQRLFGQSLETVDGESADENGGWPADRPADLLPFLGYSGRRVLRSQLDVDQWHGWQAEMNRRAPRLFRFVYHHLIHGTRRFVIDGIEPTGQADDSLQLELAELIYHRMLRQEHDWLAREVLRESFREHQTEVVNRGYSHHEAVAMMLVTTTESMLERLIAQPLAHGDLAAGANTVILMGRRLDGDRLRRGLYIAKHRGSYADQRIVAFDISPGGIDLTHAQ